MLILAMMDWTWKIAAYQQIYRPSQFAWFAGRTLPEQAEISQWLWS